MTMEDDDFSKQPPIPTVRRRMFRGDSLIFPIAVTQIPAGAPPGSQPSPANIAGWTLTYTLKFHVQDPDNQAIFQTNSNVNMTTIPTLGGIQVTNTQQGLATVTQPPSATLTFPDSKYDVFYDVQAKDLLGNIFTVERGIISVWPDISRTIV
jgi:hypothetical protein